MDALLRCKPLLLTAALAAILTACGGGGGGSDVASIPTTPVTPLVPAQPGSPTQTGDTATDGYNWFNYRRQQVGLSVLARSSLIDAAAQGHSDYQRLNNTITHDQTSGKPGYTGATLQQRLTAAGYRLSGANIYGEVISAANQTSGFYHAEELIGAIYHRFVIFEPVFREMGTGAATSSNYTYFTADFAASGGYGPGVGRGNLAHYPATSQTMVPTNFFSDSEAPDPVPDRNEVGYPISVQGDVTSTVTVKSFTVRQRGGADLPARLLSNAADSHTPKSAAAIVPLAVLKSGTVHDVTFAGTVDGIAVSLNWSFTTR
ncbi:CAP domain-containing protein [Duganella sp. FT92W]|uniref:CAP domain-containing protein n=1 Tax=Pseudoduganella rivuli TaxID=2666085 RepID=A0A7X2IUT2_9BURK|nr:CAP domain-containing protein [Pseudoduganella rivuli]MRV76324.1 CAP domain-containing protein [Pseudoduganella rivuli]